MRFGCDFALGAFAFAFGALSASRFFAFGAMGPAAAAALLKGDFDEVLTLLEGEEEASSEDAPEGGVPSDEL